MNNKLYLLFTCDDKHKVYYTNRNNVYIPDDLIRILTSEYIFKPHSNNLNYYVESDEYGFHLV